MYVASAFRRTARNPAKAGSHVLQGNENGSDRSVRLLLYGVMTVDPVAVRPSEVVIVTDTVIGPLPIGYVLVC